MVKGFNERSIKRWKQLGYTIIPQGNDFNVLRKKKEIIKIHFEPREQTVQDLDESPGTISIEGEKWIDFIKLIGIYVTDEGIVLDYQDKKGKTRTVREKENYWIL